MICIKMTDTLLFKRLFLKNILNSSIIELVILTNILKSIVIEQNLN